MAWVAHQAVHDPLHLFDGNIFFPYKYTLAFSEHCYGLALPFFPLFALGMASIPLRDPGRAEAALENLPAERQSPQGTTRSRLPR